MQNNKNRQSSIKSITLAVIVNTVIFFAITMIMTAISYSGDDPTGTIGIYALSSLVLCGVTGGFTVSKITPSFGMAIGMISAGICAIIYLAAALIASGGIRAAHLLNAACYLGAALLFSYVGRRKAPKRRKFRS